VIVMPLTYKDYKEAIEGEGWAIGDYKDLLARAETPEEKKVIKHILKEEEEHLDELWVLVKNLGLLPVGESPACRTMDVGEFREGYVDAYYPNLEGYAYQADIIGPDEGRKVMDAILKDVAWIEQCGNASPVLHMKDGKDLHVDDTDAFPAPTSEVR